MWISSQEWNEDCGWWSWQDLVACSIAAEVVSAARAHAAPVIGRGWAGAAARTAVVHTSKLEARHLVDGLARAVVSIAVHVVAHTLLWAILATSGTRANTRRWTSSASKPVCIKHMVCKKEILYHDYNSCKYNSLIHAYDSRLLSKLGWRWSSRSDQTTLHQPINLLYYHCTCKQPNCARKCTWAGPATVQVVRILDLVHAARQAAHVILAIHTLPVVTHTAVGSGLRLQHTIII